MSIYGVFERLPLLGIFSSSSIILSAAYTIYMYNRISFGGSFSKFFIENISDLTKREFFLLFTLRATRYALRTTHYFYLLLYSEYIHLLF